MSEPLELFLVAAVTIGGIALALASVVPSSDLVGPSAWQRGGRFVAILVVVFAMLAEMTASEERATRCGLSEMR